MNTNRRVAVGAGLGIGLSAFVMLSLLSGQSVPNTGSSRASSPNAYSGTHLEWNDEWGALTAANATNGTLVGSTYSINLSGAGTSLSQVVGIAGRPGVVQLESGTTTTGRFQLLTAVSMIDFADGAWSFEPTIQFPILSTAAEEYAAVIGTQDSLSSVNETDGCDLRYDRLGISTDPGTGDATGTPGDVWQLWCNDGGTRTGYLLDGTATEDGFTSVNSPVVAGTWYRLKIVEEPTRVRAYINGTEVGRITTNLPDAGDQMGAGLTIIKSAGGTERVIYLDQTSLAVDMAALRSP